MKTKLLTTIAALCSFLTISEATEPMNALSEKEQKLVVAAAFAARGDMPHLTTAINEGLDAGLSVNDLKETFVQTYAYCGFPRSLNALDNLMSVVREREAAGKTDEQGSLPSTILSGEKSLSVGTENQTKLVGNPVKGALFDFAPAIDQFLKAHLFGDIFSRDNLDWRMREIATIAMLAAMDGVESQRNSHIAIGKHNGVSDEQVQEILTIAQAAKIASAPTTGAFPKGAPNDAYAKYFTGKSWLAQLTKDARLGVPVTNVTFEPSCRNNWHSHTGGQLLIAVEGVGFYQERGKPARKLVPGDVVEVPPNVEHWHGAAPNSEFSHLAITCNPATNKNTWLEPVSDEAYAAATSEK